MVAPLEGVKGLIHEAGLSSIPEGKVAVFVGNAWDPQPGRETPWIDLARQLAGDAGVEVLGPAARTSPPGTETLGRLFQAAGGSVLILFDEVLNFFNRHRNMAENFHAFIQNLTVSMTGTTQGAAVISLPRSQVEMTDWDLQWQDRITNVVRRVAKDLIANDETEIIDPGYEWTGSGFLREQISGWTRQRGKSPRLYPGSLIWCVKKPGRDLQEKVEAWLAWKRVALEIAEGTLGGDFDRVERADIQAKVIDAEEAVKDEVWGAYRFVVLADNQEPEGLKVIDLGAGHASSGETLCGRVILALKSQALLNESVGSGYIDRNWPPALKESGAWPLSSLRQSFLNGALTRLLDPDTVLRSKIVEFVGRGEFGLASGQKPDGTYARVWLSEPAPPDEVSFEAGVFLLTRMKAQGLKGGEAVSESATFGEIGISSPGTKPLYPTGIPEEEQERIGAKDSADTITLHLRGTIPPEVWNRVGTKLIPKLRSGSELKLDVDFSATLSAKISANMEADLRQVIEDLGLGDSFEIEKE